MNKETNALVNDVEGSRSFGRGRGSQYRIKGSSKACTYCGRIWHIIETYYKKRGFPPNFGRGNGGGNLYVNHVDVDDYEENSCSNNAWNKASPTAPLESLGTLNVKGNWFL